MLEQIADVAQILAAFGVIFSLVEDLPRDPMVDAALAEKARAAVKAVLGNVTVIEDGGHVCADLDLGRWYINVGAQERT